VVFAEVLTGIALVNSASKAIKELVGNARDVSALAKHIDNLFDGEKQIQKKRMGKYKSLDPFSHTSVAEETINAKLAQEQLQEIATLIDYRFGHGTWAGIIAERAKRIREAKEAEARRRVEHRKKMEEVNTWIVTILTIMGATGVLILAILLFKKGM
tara:strand:- start:5879 stop:6349 length:471 start_codon:yes stop_codon:yes gene_type:complete